MSESTDNESTNNASSSNDRNKAVARRLYEELFGQGKLEVVDEVLAPGCVDHTPPPGLPSDDVAGALKQFTQVLRRAFPDIRVTAGPLVAEGDLVAAHWTAEGTHEGEFFGAAPTGERVSLGGLDLLRIIDGRCTDHWGFDAGTALAR